MNPSTDVEHSHHTFYIVTVFVYVNFIPLEPHYWRA